MRKQCEDNEEPFPENVSTMSITSSDKGSSINGNSSSDPQQSMIFETGCQEYSAKQEQTLPDSDVTGTEQNNYEQPMSVKEFSLNEMVNLLNELLSDFAVEFMREGWGNMINCIRSVLVHQTKNQYQLESHYFMWLVEYFLRMARSKELPFQYVM